jgi:methyl-accepting chemotaxis protein
MLMCSAETALHTVKRSKARLKDCVQGLEVLSASTEDQFLDIGNRLTAFYEGAAKVSGLSKTIADFLSGGDIAGTIQKLTALMEGFGVQMKHFESIIGESIIKLDSISERIEDAEWHLEDMDRATRMLGGLGFSTGLQNAILKRPVEGIRVLGEDVKKLASDITRKSGHIVRDTKSLVEVINDSRSKIRELSSIQQKKAAKILRSTTSNIASLNEKYGLSAKAAEKISSCSDEISQCIREIVTFIQFHDIMRQRFESSRSFFNRMVEDLEAETGEGDLHWTVNRLAEFCVEAGALLQSTRTDFISVVMTVIENLRVLSTGVKGLLSEVRHLVSVGDSMEGSFLAKIDESLSSVTMTISTLSESGMLKGQLSDATTVAVKTVGEMSGVTRAIEYIGDEVELIALNAAVKADQMGEEGRAIGIVADEIQRISAKAQLHTSSIAAILKDVGAYAEDLSIDVGAGENVYTLKVAELSEKLSASVGYLRDLNSKLISTIREVEETGKGLVSEVDGVIGNIGIHKDVDLVVGEVLSNLREVFAEAGRTLADRTEPGDAHLSLSNDAYYLMLEAAVKQLQSDGRTGTVGGRSEDLGDNIEFFS